MKDFAICSVITLAAVVVSVFITLGVYALGINIGIQGGLITTMSLAMAYMMADRICRSADNWLEGIMLCVVLVPMCLFPLFIVAAIAQPI